MAAKAGIRHQQQVRRPQPEVYIRFSCLKGQSTKSFIKISHEWIIFYDTPDGLGGEFTSTSLVQKVPGQNQLMLYGTASNANHRFLARYAYSGFVAAINDVKNVADFAMYPNPASDICTIFIPDESGEKYSAQLIDMMGKEISTRWDLTGRLNTFSIVQYASGLYMLRVSDSKGIQSVRKLRME